MADDQNDTERTEDPTQKRLDEALERGDVVKSQEVNTWFVIGGGDAGADGVFRLDGRAASTTTFRGAHRQRLSDPGRRPRRSSRSLAGSSVEVLAAVALPFCVLVLAAIAGNLVQHRLVWSVEPLKPKFSKVSPLAGLKRLFSEAGAGQFRQGPHQAHADRRGDGWRCCGRSAPARRRWCRPIPAALLPFTQLAGARSCSARWSRSWSLVAAADYLFQYRQWFERQKMSLREIKEEFKQTEGDPLIKGKIRQLRQSRMRKRMMAAVPKASVIITNPTHFAVALQYERGMDGADLRRQGRRRAWR